jgi:hypothetical protein
MSFESFPRQEEPKEEKPEEQQQPETVKTEKKIEQPAEKEKVSKAEKSKSAFLPEFVPEEDDDTLKAEAWVLGMPGASWEGVRLHYYGLRMPRNPEEFKKAREEFREFEAKEYGLPEKASWGDIKEKAEKEREQRIDERLEVDRRLMTKKYGLPENASWEEISEKRRKHRYS